MTPMRTSFISHTLVRLSILNTATWLVMLLCPKADAVEFNSGIINFDLNFTEVGDPPYGPGAGVIGSSGDLWNTVSLTHLNDGPLNLFNAAGSLTSVNWSCVSGGGISSPNVGGAYARLVDVSSSCSSASINGLNPNQNYNLYLFSAYHDQSVGVNGNIFTTTGIRFGNVNSLTAGNQFDFHTVTANSAGTLEFSYISTRFSETFLVSSWQLTPVPEPSTFSLAGLALMSIVAYRLRFQKS